MQARQVSVMQMLCIIEATLATNQYQFTRAALLVARVSSDPSVQLM